MAFIRWFFAEIPLQTLNPGIGSQSSAANLPAIPPLVPAPASSPAPPQVSASPAPLPTPPAVPPPAAAPAASDPPQETGVITVIAEGEPPPPESPKPVSKLKPMRGWSATNVTSRQDHGTKPAGPVYYLSQPSQPPAAPAVLSPAGQAPIPSVPTPAAPPAPKARAAFRTVPGGGGSATAAPGTPLPSRGTPRVTVQGGGPIGTMDHLPGGEALPPPQTEPQPGPPSHYTIIAPPDPVPTPNPESPRTQDGPCPRRGWWKNSATFMCYFTRESCEAAGNRRGTCSQPNP